MKCLIEKCHQERNIRGVCKRHYTGMHLRVKKGRNDWKTFEDHGMILPSTRSNTSWIDEMLANKSISPIKKRTGKVGRPRKIKVTK